MGVKKVRTSWNKGIKYTKEQKDRFFSKERSEKLSKALTGRKVTWGDKMSKTRKRLIAEGKIKFLKGKDSPKWKGGAKNWQRKQNLKRLNDAGVITCECCGGIEKLLVHHKDGDHNNNEFDNLMLLQHRCHSKGHFKLRKVCNKCKRLYGKFHKCPTRDERSKIAKILILERERCINCGKLFGTDKSKHSCKHPKGMLGKRHTEESKQRIKEGLKKTFDARRRTSK